MSHVALIIERTVGESFYTATYGPRGQFVWLIQGKKSSSENSLEAFDEQCNILFGYFGYKIALLRMKLSG